VRVCVCIFWGVTVFFNIIIIIKYNSLLLSLSLSVAHTHTHTKTGSISKGFGVGKDAVLEGIGAIIEGMQFTRPSDMKMG